jgi:U3 small nucleolar ribonucleoprotein protein IMP4
MLRRAARERREFIYKKAIEQRQKAIEDKRDRLKNALDGILFAWNSNFNSN